MRIAHRVRVAWIATTRPRFFHFTSPVIVDQSAGHTARNDIVQIRFIKLIGEHVERPRIRRPE